MGFGNFPQTNSRCDYMSLENLRSLNENANINGHLNYDERKKEKLKNYTNTDNQTRTLILQQEKGKKRKHDSRFVFLLSN